MVQIAFWIVLILINLCGVICIDNSSADAALNTNKASKENKNLKPAEVPTLAKEQEVGASNKILTESQINKTDKTNKTEQNSDAAKQNKTIEGQVNNPQANKLETDASSPDQYDQLKRKGIDIEDSEQTAFYILIAISVSALMFVGFKVYKLRLTRAERKYGVQGNHATQELAHLPTSMEDGESEEEDQTIFDINREQIRIF